MSNFKLTSKAQTNISIIEVTKNKHIIIKKATSKKDVAYSKALESTLSEWNSKNDDEDYESL